MDGHRAGRSPRVAPGAQEVGGALKVLQPSSKRRTSTGSFSGAWTTRQLLGPSGGGGENTSARRMATSIKGTEPHAYEPDRPALAGPLGEPVTRGAGCALGGLGASGARSENALRYVLGNAERRVTVLREMWEAKSK
jgi:hypothetical protein